MPKGCQTLNATRDSAGALGTPAKTLHRPSTWARSPRSKSFVSPSRCRHANTQRLEPLECGARWVAACPGNGNGCQHATCGHRRVNCQLTTAPKATQSAGKQTNKSPTKQWQNVGIGLVWPGLARPGNSPALLLVFRHFFFCLAFLWLEWAKEKTESEREQDAEKFILNEKLFQLHQRK